MTRLYDLLGNGTAGVVLWIAMIFLSIIGLFTLIAGIYRLLARAGHTEDNDGAAMPDIIDEVEDDEPGFAIADQEPAEDPDEIAAVIAAAIAASLNRSTHSVIVRSIRRLSSEVPAWNRVARQEQTAARL